MLADALHNCRCTGVTNRKTLTGNTIDECLTGSCSIECNISDDDILGCIIADTILWVDNDLTTGKSLTDIIVAVANQFQRESLRDKCTETLSTAAVAFDNKCILIQSCSIFLRNLRTEDRTE